MCSLCGSYLWCWLKKKYWEFGSLNSFTDSTELNFMRCHECEPEEVRTRSVTTQPDRGSIVKWKRSPGKAIIKLSYSTATGAGLAFSDRRSCWAHITCKTERDRVCERNNMKDLAPNVFGTFTTLSGTFLITFILQKTFLSSTIPFSPVLSTSYQAWNIIMPFYEESHSLLVAL